MSIASSSPSPPSSPTRESSLDPAFASALSSLSLSLSPSPASIPLPGSPPSPPPPPSPAAPAPAPSVALFTAPACALHTYIRTPSSAQIVERPQRLRSVALGFALALSRLSPSSSPLAQLVPPVPYSHIDLRTHPATQYVHGTLSPDEPFPSPPYEPYIPHLQALAEASAAKAAAKQSEIPPEWSQGDLYLSPGSWNALQASVATVCAAVDLVCTPESPKRAFAPVRPPGHHCSATQPAGFCFLNNVAIAAAHAHLHHGITRIAILDIDLHHGNGTQALAWAINAATHRQSLAPSSSSPSRSSQPQPAGLQVYYGSLHDVLSYPCELGEPALTQAASLSLHGAHGQHIENIHLEPYTSPTSFHHLYETKYSLLLSKVASFFSTTASAPGQSLVLISCGFDASSYELPSMSRHGRHVPPGFYARFAEDAHRLADEYAGGKAVSVLEGGYGERALVSGSMAYLAGMLVPGAAEEEWWAPDEMARIEKAFPAAAAAKPRKPSARLSAPPVPAEPYLARAHALLSQLLPDLSPEEQIFAPLPPPAAAKEPHRMGLRDRKPLTKTVEATATPPRDAAQEKEKEKDKRAPRRAAKSAGNTPAKKPVNTNGVDALAASMRDLSVASASSTANSTPTPATRTKEAEMGLKIRVRVPAGMPAGVPAPDATGAAEGRAEGA